MLMLAATPFLVVEAVCDEPGVTKRTLFFARRTARRLVSSSTRDAAVCPGSAGRLIQEGDDMWYEMGNQQEDDRVVLVVLSVCPMSTT